MKKIVVASIGICCKVLGDPYSQLRDQVRMNHHPFWHLHTDFLSTETDSLQIPVCGWNEVRIYVYTLNQPFRNTLRPSSSDKVIPDLHLM